jgi:hypothetical protein
LVAQAKVADSLGSLATKDYAGKPAGVFSVTRSFEPVTLLPSLPYNFSIPVHLDRVGAGETFLHGRKDVLN